jgi:hypothetical protein
MKKYIKVIDNFLPQEMFDEVQQHVTYNEVVDWIFMENRWYSFEKTSELMQVLNLTEKIIPTNLVQMIHSLYNKNGFVTSFPDVYGKVLEYFHNSFEIEILITAKLNMTFPFEENYLTGFHTDFQYENTPNYKTAIMYLNDNDGYTLLEDGTKIEAKSNRIVIFDGTTQHCGTTCTDENKRITLNLNYIGKDL